MAVKHIASIANHLVFPPSNPAQKAGQKDGTALYWATSDIPVVEEKLGTVNLLTDTVVKTAASKEIKISKPLNFPEKLMYMFERKSPEINMKIRNPESAGVRDEIHINMQSGTQWDGLQHFSY
ncbi:hypothetical protein B0H14DRAFT_3496868 [Mycena olivaceomarginata]|nr:hypothetical protein B0H14DRAFT_3496868 [Mycena olivaceomarginata]